MRNCCCKITSWVSDTDRAGAGCTRNQTLRHVITGWSALWPDGNGRADTLRLRRNGRGVGRQKSDCAEPGRARSNHPYRRQARRALSVPAWRPTTAHRKPTELLACSKRAAQAFAEAKAAGKAGLEHRMVGWNRRRFTDRVEGDSRHAEVNCHAVSFVERPS